MPLGGAKSFANRRGMLGFMGIEYERVRNHLRKINDLARNSLGYRYAIPQ